MVRHLVVLLLCVPVAFALAEETVTFQPASPHQGEPFIVHLSSAKALAWAEGELFGLSLHLEPLGEDLIAMGGVPRNQKPGDYPLTLTVQYADGTSGNVEATLTVIGKQFDTQKLSVDPKYVELDEEALAWIRKDNAAAAKAYASSVDTRLWHKPFIKPAEGRWSAPFGVRRMFNGEERSYHSGVDIAIGNGTPVKASNDGRVVLVRHMFFGGKTVIIDHGHNAFTGYMHLSEFKAEEGQLVEQGDVIGLSGSTGRVTGPHLHWMLRIESEKLDAQALLNLKVR